MRWSLFRIVGILVGAWIVWSLLSQFAGILFPLCAAVAGWRLWLAMPKMPGQRLGDGRPSSPPSAPPWRQDRDQDAPAPPVAPVSRSSRSFDRALAELDSNPGLVAGAGFHLAGDVDDALMEACGTMLRARAETFGNGRDMRTLWERTREAQTARVMRQADRMADDLVTVEAADIDVRRQSGRRHDQACHRSRPVPPPGRSRPGGMAPGPGVSERRHRHGRHLGRPRAPARGLAPGSAIASLGHVLLRMPALLNPVTGGKRDASTPRASRPGAEDRARPPTD